MRNRGEVMRIKEQLVRSRGELIEDKGAASEE